MERRLCLSGFPAIRGNSAAKDAIAGDILVELIPFSDLKARTSKCMLELWQSEWGEFPENKLHIFPNLKECVVCPRTNKRRDCNSPIAQWP